MNLTLLIILGIVLVVVGFLLALLVGPLLGADDKSSKEPATGALASEQSEIAAQPQVSTRTLRAWRDPQEKLTVEIDGQVFNNMTELNQEQRQFLTSTINSLIAWVRQAMLEPSPPAPVEEPVPPPSPTSTPPVESSSKATSQNKVNAFLQTLQPASSKSQSQTKSLAAQVDEVLQEKLAYSELSHHTVHLHDLPNYGMSVQVDHERYDSIDAVPDETVRNLIRESVQEWQRRSSSRSL